MELALLKDFLLLLMPDLGSATSAQNHNLFGVEIGKVYSDGNSNSMTELELNLDCCVYFISKG